MNNHPSDPALQDYFFIHSTILSNHEKETSLQFYIKLKQIQEESIISEEENNLENMSEEQILCHHFLEAMEKANPKLLEDVDYYTPELLEDIHQ